MPWNKGTKGVMKVNSGSFKKGHGKVKLEIRFWDKVKKTNNCWLWLASKNNMGYGRINVSGNVILAHRMSYRMSIGYIPKGMSVLHKCDTPLCVNPKHLFLGTQKDNNQDRDRKGRACLNENRSQAKLTLDKAREIRHVYKLGEHSQRKLAKLFGVSQVVIFNVIHDLTYK